MITCTINVCRLKRELERLCTMTNKNVKMSIDHNAYVGTWISSHMKQHSSSFYSTSNQFKMHVP